MKKLNDIPTAELARFLSVTTAFVSNLKAGKRPMPPKTALRISETFGIPLWELRPDIYPEHLFNKDVSRL
jgi:plasmid maintenance system antidote protein VapI